MPRTGACHLHVESSLAQIQRNSLRRQLHRAVAFGCQRERGRSSALRAVRAPCSRSRSVGNRNEYPLSRCGSRLAVTSPCF